VRPAEQTSKPPEVKKVLTEEELKAKYEVGYRSAQTESLLSERDRLKRDREKAVSDESKRIEYKKQVETEAAERKRKELEIQKAAISASLKISSEQEAILVAEKKSRGFLKGFKYKFGVQDPVDLRLSTLLSARQNLFQKFRLVSAEMDSVSQNLVATLEDLDKEKEISLAGTEALYADKRGTLYEKTHQINTASREAIRNTAESLERGDLDVSKLAIDENALVVHSLPLEGWDVAQTSYNNKEIDIKVMKPEDKIATIMDKQPDLSASVITAGDKIERQGMMYPFALILDGKVLATYDQDSPTVTDGLARRRKVGDGNLATLQSDTVDRFAQVAHQAAPDYRAHMDWNESIIHQPKVKGVLLDESRLLLEEDRGDRVFEDILLENATEAQKSDGIVVTSKKGPNAGKEVVKIMRERTGMEKALEFARGKYPSLPIYIRRSDGIYTETGEKVTAKDIYSV
jgi:hypothetical protein